MQAGYFDDPPDVPGFAHWLEHAVHLGSDRYPDEKDYKYYLSQHGGTSNASTGMVHTSYHLTVSAPHLRGALDRLARFFVDPLLQRDSLLREVENVHAEFSRNCNSDSRKLLQLRRAAAGGPLGQFSTGNLATLRDGPAAAGRDVPAALAAFWRERYLGGALCGCVVGPQGLGELEEWVAGVFAEVRAVSGEAGPPPEQGEGERVEGAGDRGRANSGGLSSRGGAEGAGDRGCLEGGGAAPSSSTPAAAPAAASRYDLAALCGPGRLGRLFRVASQRELRQLEVVWYLPYGMMRDMRSKPWRWAGHVLGHEGAGSLAALLRGAGLAQELSTGPFDEVRLGRGFMFWGVTLTLSEAGMARAHDILRLVFAAVQAMCALPEAARAAVWDEVAACGRLRWQYQDRSAPLDLAREAAQRLHYFAPEEVLSAPALLSEHDPGALDRFLSHLTPANANVFLADSSFKGATQHVEPWYGARYSEEPIPPELHADAATAAPQAAAANGVAGGAAPGAGPQHPRASSTACEASSRPCAGSPAAAAGGSGAEAAAHGAAGTHSLPPSGASYGELLARLRLMQPPNWALPVDVRMVAEEVARQRRAEQEEVAQVLKEGASSAGKEEVQMVTVQEQPPGGGREEKAAAGSGTVEGEVESDGAPQLIRGDERDGGAVRLWHRLDVSFGVPKAHVFVHLITRAAYASPVAWVTARLACRLMDELLAPRVYDAALVGTSYSLSPSETGIHLALHGFSGVVPRLARVVAEAVAGVTLQEVEARYGLVHGKLLQSLRLWRHNNPAQHAEYGCEHVLQAPHWHAEESVAVLERAAAARVPAAGGASQVEPEAAVPAEAEVEAGPRAVWELLRGVGHGAAMEVLVYGNMTRREAEELCDMLQSHLRPTGLGPEGWPATRILRLGDPDASQQQPAAPPPPAPPPAGPPLADLAQAPAASGGADCAEGTQGPQGEVCAEQAPEGGIGPGSGGAGAPVLLRYVPPNPNPTNNNSAIFFLCQVGEDDPRDVRPGVLLDLLVAAASKPAFHALRTRQRLGYAVALQRQRLGGCVGVSVRVQSPDRDPGVLRARVAEWLAGFGEELAALPAERLASFKASLRERYLEPPRSLAGAARQAWQPVRYRTYAFERRRLKAQELERVTLQELVAFYEQHVNPAAPTARVLCTELWGGTAGPKLHEEETSTSHAAGHEGKAEAGMPPLHSDAAWRLSGPEEVSYLHGRLPHYCHSATLGVLQPRYA